MASNEVSATRVVQWATGTTGSLALRAVIDAPELELVDVRDHTAMGCLATAMHAVHAIPVVRGAPAGILDLADVPGFVGGHRGFGK